MRTYTLRLKTADENIETHGKLVVCTARLSKLIGKGKINQKRSGFCEIKGRKFFLIEIFWVYLLCMRVMRKF